MTGMGRSLQTNDPIVVNAFRSALDRQFLFIVVLAIALVLAWNVIRTINYRRAVASGTFEPPAPRSWPYPEPAARRLLRITFGFLWILDGLLQAQSAMPLGLPGTVITPAASSSPGWVQHLVNAGTTIWSDHPVTAAAATVWIQLGVGVFLLVAPRGIWSRAAGGVSAGWGLVVWTFGEAFGGIFGHGTSWLFGSPGAAVFYIAAGGLVALPDRSWEARRLGRRLLAVMGVFFIGMGVLQAWPGRGSWTGQAHASATPGALTAMVQSMSRASQPSLFASWSRWFASVDAAHGWAVNLVVVVALIGIGACFVSGDRRAARVGVVAGSAFCLAVWVLVQDFGFFGGVGTDPNSMLPMAAVFITGYVAMVRLPARAAEPVSDDRADSVAALQPAAPVEAAGAGSWLDRLTPSYLLRSLAAIGAVGIVLIGAAPMALASTSATADPILAQAADGTPTQVDLPAAPFTLTDQSGRPVSLASFRGHTVALTFLDPVCTSDCPLIAQEMRLADQMLGSEANSVDLVAVVNNPLYRSPAMTAAFDKQEGLDHVANWSYLTGSLAQLARVWNAYGVQTAVSPAGSMVAHSDILYVIDGQGHTRAILDSSPGGSSTADQSSFSGLLVSQIRRVASS